MKVQTALHALTLGTCLALGAGFWHLREELSQPALPAASLRPDPAPASSRSRDLELELESLRLRVAELEARPPIFQMTPAGEAAASVSESPSSSAQGAALEAALLKLAEQSLQKGGGSTVILGEQRKPATLDGMNLSDYQKDSLEKILAESKAFTNELLRKRVKKEALPEQLKADLDRHRAEVDARAQQLLSAEQFAEYRDRLKDSREMTDRMLSQEIGKGLTGAASPFRGLH